MNAVMNLTTPRLFFCLAVCACAVFAAPKPPPASTLTVTSEPDGAVVELDRAVIGTTPVTRTDLAPGTHLLSVRKEGFAPYFETIQLVVDGRKSVQAKLAALTGVLMMQTDPADAEVVTADGLSLGRTPLLCTTLPLGVHRLTVKALGYSPKRVEVNLADRTPVRLALALASDSGILDVRSEPTDAEVSVNGLPRGRTPCRVDRIAGGDQVQVSIAAEGYKSFQRMISLAAGELQQIDAVLEALPGTLRIVSIPPGARVYVDDAYKGEADLVLHDVKPGARRVRVERKGCGPMARTVELGRGVDQTEEFRLQPNVGTLTLVTAPADAEVLIDGQPVGRTQAAGGSGAPISDPLSLEDVEEGERILLVTRKGFFDHKQPVTVVRGEVQPVHVTLKRRFIPDYQVTTTRSQQKGVLISKSEDEIRLELRPGVFTSIPMHEVRQHGPLEETQP